MADLDFSTPAGKRALDRLEHDIAIWLTTVTPSGYPAPTPVWFVWENGTILIHALKGSHKIEAIRQHPQVSLNFSADEHGHDVTVLRGTAELLDEASLPSETPAFREKYRNEFASSPVTPESYDRDYRQVIRVTPTAMHGF